MRLGRLSWTALGTTATVLTADPRQIESAAAAVREELEAIDLAASRFRSDSDLSRVNAAAGRPVRVGELLIEAVAVALEAAQLTDGVVDPTVGRALIELGYDRDFEQLRDDPRGGGPIIAVRTPGPAAVEVDAAARTVRVDAGATLDLGATAKALAADRAALAATLRTGTGVLVNLGGDIATAGTPPDGGWIVLVTDDHAAPLDAPGQTVGLTGGGLATSSTTVRRWRRHGRTVHHIIDPTTGAPAAGPWQTVSVAAASCVDANTASTAAMIMAADAPGWLVDRGLAARLVSSDGNVTTLGGWPDEAAA